MSTEDPYQIQYAWRIFLKVNSIWRGSRYSVEGLPDYGYVVFPISSNGGSLILPSNVIPQLMHDKNYTHWLEYLL